MKQNKAAMKAKVLFPVEEPAIKVWEGKRRCDVIVQGEDGAKYTIFATEGTAAWSLAKDAEVDITTFPDKPGKAKLTQNNTGSGFRGNYTPRKEYTIEEVGKTAEIAARLAAHVFVSLRKALQEKGEGDVTAEDVRTMTNTLIIELVKRLP
jgi:hypothetical protein